jgi:hypothetical protein
MEILKVAIVIAVLVSIVKSMNRFNEHCLRKCGHAFFTRSAFWQTAAAVALIVGGNL